MRKYVALTQPKLKCHRRRCLLPNTDTNAEGRSKHTIKGSGKIGTAFFPIEQSSKTNVPNFRSLPEVATFPAAKSGHLTLLYLVSLMGERWELW